jgi:hypothetical protein
MPHAAGLVAVIGVPAALALLKGEKLDCNGEKFLIRFARFNHPQSTQEKPTVVKDKTKRISAKTLAEDLESLEALETITDYAPANPNLTSAKLKNIKDGMTTKQATETQAQATAAAARDDATASEWALHEAVVGMRDQVVAQFGRSSNQAQSVGRKKDTERKAPKSKKDQK